MEIAIKLNGTLHSFQFDVYSELAQSRILFTKVMCYKDQKSGELFPIQFEQERIDFILSIYRKDKQKFIHLKAKEANGENYLIVNDKKRFNLQWLYQQHTNKMEPKVKKKQATATNVKKNKENVKNKKTNILINHSSNRTKLKQVLKDSQTIKLYMMSKEERNKLKKGTATKVKKNKTTSKPSKYGFKYEDAMNHRVPGSFGTGKRR